MTEIFKNLLINVKNFDIILLTIGKGEEKVRLKELRKEYGLTQGKLAEKIGGISRSTIAMYESGGSEPDIQTLNKLANFFSVSIDYLLGKNEKTSNSLRIPVLGLIPAGVPIEAIEDILDYEEISPDMLKGGKEYFALKIKGDSMSPKYLDGDVVIFLKQDCAESNEDCCVYVNGYDATFKRVKITQDGIMLHPININYEPMFFSSEQIETLPVRVIGKAVEIRRKI